MQRVRLQVYPDDDRRFRELATLLLDGGADTPARLQTALRDEYPRARVIEGIQDGITGRWYVYRDGRLVGGGGGSIGSATPAAR